MFQNCTIQRLMDQQNIIHKQRETIEKKKTSTNKVKTKTYKNNRGTRKKQKQLNKLKKPKKSFKILCPLCKDRTFDLNNPTNYNRHLKKCKVVQEKKKAKEKK